MQLPSLEIYSSMKCLCFVKIYIFLLFLKPGGNPMTGGERAFLRLFPLSDGVQQLNFAFVKGCKLKFCLSEGVKIETFPLHRSSKSIFFLAEGLS